MIIKPTSIEKLKQLYLEIFLSTTNKVSKVSPTSTTNAHAYGVAKLSQKILKDAAIIESNLFPNVGVGDQLDGIALNRGMPTRFAATGSITYVRILAEPTTFYEAGVVQFTGSHGVIFNLLSDVTVDDTGIAYAKVQSVSTGASSNVNPLTLNSVINEPTGHEQCTNEYIATGGRDEETDTDMRARLINGFNLLATDTIEKYKQLFINAENSVLDILRGGYNQFNQYIFYVQSVNGYEYTQNELDNMAEQVLPYASFDDVEKGIDVRNVSYKPIDVSFRCDLSPNANPDIARKNAQINVQKVFDYRNYNTKRTYIDYEDLLLAVIRTQGINRVYEDTFTPDSDIPPTINTYPRIRSFIMYDSDGNVISDTTGVLTPTFFPNEPNVLTQETLLS